MDDFDELFAQLFGITQPRHEGTAGEPVTEPTSVFRIEMPDGRGPYNSSLPNHHEIYLTICSRKRGFNCAKNAADNHEQMGETERCFKDAHGHAAYGCTSIDALCDWFPEPARRYLKMQGAQVIEYLVPAGGYTMTENHGEVIFNRVECDKMRTLDVVTLA